MYYRLNLISKKMKIKEGIDGKESFERTFPSLDYEKLEYNSVLTNEKTRYRYKNRNDNGTENGNENGNDNGNENGNENGKYFIFFQKTWSNK